MTTFKANRKFPNPITVTDDPKSHTLALQQIIEALNIGQRRTKEIDSSYVRVHELVDVGLIETVGNQLKLTNLGAAAVSASIEYLTFVGQSVAPVADTLWMDDGSNYDLGSMVWGNPAVFLGEVAIGDPGQEQGVIQLDGSSHTAILKVNDFGSSKDAELVLHHHSNTRSANLNIVRSKSGAASHGDVANTDVIGTIDFAGWYTNSYWRAASIEVTVDGTPATNDMPGAMRFKVSADGTVNLTERLGLYANGSVKLGTDGFLVFDEHSSAPATPASGTVALYAKSDGKLYIKDDAGTETDLTDVGSGGAITGADMYAVSLNDLADVAFGLPADNDVLTYDSGTGVWTAAALSASWPQTIGEESSAPSAPADNNFKLFGWNLGATLPAILGPTGEIIPIFGPSAGVRFAGIFATATTWDTLGAWTATDAGTVSNPAMDPTSANVAAQTLRRRYTSTSGTTNGASHRNAIGTFWYRDISGNTRGDGFFLWCRFALSTVKSDQRLFIGMYPSSGAATIGASGVNAQTNVVGLGKEDSDTNLFFIHNDGSGNCTKVDLGVALTTLTNDLIDLYMYCEPSGANVRYAVYNRQDGTLIGSGAVSTDLPAADQGLTFQFIVNNGSLSAAAVAGDLMGASLVSFF
jgi:hypothetical protein